MKSSNSPRARKPRCCASCRKRSWNGSVIRQTRKVDVRVITATHEDLENAVKQGRFRADLFYRLNVFPVRIPALRERREDIPLLIEHFLEKLHASYKKKTLGLSDRALQVCLHYDWPGNIRELENLMERGVIITDENQSITVDALFPHSPQLAESIGLASDGRLVKSDARQRPGLDRHHHRQRYGLDWRGGCVDSGGHGAQPTQRLGGGPPAGHDPTGAGLPPEKVPLDLQQRPRVVDEEAALINVEAAFGVRLAIAQRETDVPERARCPIPWGCSR